MNRPASLIDVVIRWRWFRDGKRRRLILAFAALAAALLALFPRAYIGDVKLAPQDTDTAGLRSIVSQLGGNYAALLGQHQPVEIDLTIGRSYEVQSEVARRMGRIKKEDPSGIRRAVKQLNRDVTVRALRAGIIEIEVKGHDAAEVVKTADVYSKVLQERLSKLSRTQTDYKQFVLDERRVAAAQRLARAKAAITEFRNRNNLISPEVQMGDAVAALAGLRNQLQRAEVELAKLRRINTDENVAVRTVLAEIDGLREQIAIAENRIATQSGLTASGIAPKALEYERLNLDLRFAQSVHESYARYFEGAAIERLTANFNIQIIEPPYLDLGWHFNTIPSILFILIILLGLAAEFFYFRPPPGVPQDQA